MRWVKIIKDRHFLSVTREGITDDASHHDLWMLWVVVTKLLRGVITGEKMKNILRVDKKEMEIGCCFWRQQSVYLPLRPFNPPANTVLRRRGQMLNSPFKAKHRCL